MDLKDIEGASLAIRRVTATGAGVKVEHATLSGDITWMVGTLALRLRRES